MDSGGGSEGFQNFLIILFKNFLASINLRQSLNQNEIFARKASDVASLYSF